MSGQAKDFSVSGLMAEGGKAWSRGDGAAAATLFAQAALAVPALTQAHVNLGVALRKQGHVTAAVVSYRRALQADDNDPAIHSNLGNALREIGQLAEAETHLRRAVALRPDTASFRYNLALLLRDRRQHEEARALFAALVAQFPDSGEYAWDLALSDLYLGDYAKGFAGYEARWRLARTPRRDFTGPQVQPGQDVRTKTVLVAAEQGFGDSLQFARFLPLVAGRCARLVVECQPEQMDLFAGIKGVAHVFAKGDVPPAYDVWIPIMSLAHWLGLGPADLPGPVPYLRPARALAKPLGRPPGTRLNVGLIWAGKTVPRDRSWPLEHLMVLMQDPGLAFWSLQMGERSNDLKRLGVGALVRDLAPLITSFADTAALMNAMDVIVSIDTSAAHLAGALGRPTAVLLRYVSDWRWLDQGDSCRWYPSLRLFRQPQPDDFTAPVLQLKAWLDQRGEGAKT